MDKHTPGPWHLINEGSCVVVDPSRIQETFIASVYGDNGNGNFGAPRLEANARLIAAAPDLLAALMLVENRFGAHCIDPLPLDLCERITAVIAKATGESA